MTALAKIGGADIKTRATRLMERLFSNCVAEKFSWIGGKKKMIFSNLLLCGVILGRSLDVENIYNSQHCYTRYISIAFYK